MSDIKLGMCDKRQYEHNGPHPQIVDWGQNHPPFPCVNWHEVVPDEGLESVRSIAERTGIANEIGFATEIEDDSDQTMLARAWRISTEVHALQIDKGGQSYLFHCARVAMAGQTVLEQVCGLLHDVLEDSPNAGMWLHTFELEFPPEVLVCLVALCRKEGEDYMDYIRRVAENPLATKVKLADLHDNLNPERLIALPSDVMHRLLTRYGQAVKLLVMSKGKR